MKMTVKSGEAEVSKLTLSGISFGDWKDIDVSIDANRNGGLSLKFSGHNPKADGWHQRNCKKKEMSVLTFSADGTLCVHRKVWRPHHDHDDVDWISEMRPVITKVTCGKREDTLSDEPASIIPDIVNY